MSGRWKRSGCSRGAHVAGAWSRFRQLSWSGVVIIADGSSYFPSAVFVLPEMDELPFSHAFRVFVTRMVGSGEPQLRAHRSLSCSRRAGFQEALISAGSRHASFKSAKGQLDRVRQSAWGRGAAPWHSRGRTCPRRRLRVGIAGKRDAGCICSWGRN